MEARKGSDPLALSPGLFDSLRMKSIFVAIGQFERFDFEGADGKRKAVAAQWHAALFLFHEVAFPNDLSGEGEFQRRLSFAAGGFIQAQDDAAAIFRPLDGIEDDVVL